MILVKKLAYVYVLQLSGIFNKSDIFSSTIMQYLVREMTSICKHNINRMIKMIQLKMA